MQRKPITVKGFIKGLTLKGDCIGEPSIMRMVGFKFSDRPGALESRGGFADWDVTSDFTYINGIKRWYREDGGVNLFIFGTSGGVRGIYHYNLESRTVVLVQAISDIIDDEFPVEWVDCGSQLIVLPYGNIRPYSIKLNELGNSNGGIISRQLGLTAPSEAMSLSHALVRGGINATPNQFDEFKYCITYSYGTLTEPEKYGQSGPGPVISTRLFPTVDPNDLEFTLDGIVPIGSPPGIIKRINIYRTKENQNTFFKVGQITEPNVGIFVDRLPDDKIGVAPGTGDTLPLYTGIPTGIRCAMWHPGLQRLYWFGFDGYFHWSAAGLPDVNPLTQRMKVGSLGYLGNSVVHIQNSIYGLKEDGVYLIQGDAPNYYSRKISSVGCVARSGLAEMPDGFYFPGMESKNLKVYKFNGNSAIPVSESINRLLPGNKSSVLKRMFGKRVGDEYWLSLMIMDKRFCAYPVPFNNCILPYDYRYGEWAGTIPCQASSIEVFDGPGDSGEVFISESDPIASAAKGTFFRLEKRGGSCNQTRYDSGIRIYNKTQVVSGLLTYGMINGFSEEDASLEEISIKSLKVRSKGYMGLLPFGRVYLDDKELETTITPSIFMPAENSNLKTNDLDLTSDSACVVGTGKTDHATSVASNIQDWEFTFVDDKIRTGTIPEVEFGSRAGKLIEIEALECLFNSTSKG